MSASRHLWLAVASVLVAGWAGTAESARRKAEPTLGSLAGRSAPVDRSLPVQAEPDDAANSYEAFLRIDGADPALKAQALRRLGDLRLEQAAALSGTGDVTDPAAQARAREAVAAYQELLRDHPDYAARDAALYQLARASEVAGDPDAAMAALDELVQHYPQGAHADEAQFRRGEVYFSAQRYADAGQAYGAVLAMGPASPFYEQALYKRGWARFKLSDNAASSRDFLALLDRLLVQDDRLRDAAQITRPEQELADDTLRALSLMFAADEGAASLQAALSQRGPAPYESRLYRALGDLYVEKERFQDGAEVYRSFARRQPLDPEAPFLLGKATEAYGKAGFTGLVLESKQELVELYGPRSAYWAQHGANIDPRVSAAVQANLLDLARHHHALAQKQGGDADRDAAVRWYRDYLDGFDATAEAPATRLLLADLLLEGLRYAEAADEYEKAAYNYQNAPEAGRAGYAALVALDKAEPTLPEAERPALRQRAIESSLRFASTFPEHVETPAVLTRTTKQLFDLGDRERAEAVAQGVLALGARADAGQQLVAWTVLAHTYFDSSRFAEAERAYGEILARTPASQPQHAEAVERRAAAVYRQAEVRREAGDTAGAVQDFLRVAIVAPASPIRAKAEFDAAALLLQTRQWTEAAVVLEGFRRSYPQHELAADVDRKLAVAYVESGQQARAAAEFERVAARETEDPEVRRTALWQAAELQVAAGDPASASRVYAEYVKRYPAPVGPALDARQTLADLARDANDIEGRKRWLEDIIVADRGAGSARTDRTKYLAATAALELARPLDAAARTIRLALPLETSFAAKRKALEAALGAYGRAEEYGVAQVTTASAFAMADLYRHLGRALLESDRPNGLDAEELEQYDVLLEEQAFPFEEKAIGIHERNARLAAQGVYDEWVQRSYAELAQLKPGRYARAEVADAPATVPPLPPEADPAAQNQRGVQLRQAGRFADAKAAYERALTLDPNYADAERNLAILHDLYLDDPSAALPHFERYQLLTQGADTQVAAWVAELKARIAAVTRTAEATP
ncbi:MAG: tetratricopeptide repeat protein [Gammaproteobacteria bacterium]|nr:tetratricopeptide repeat protein [Gammaproteobacteria bacterium]MDH5273056.1 tetratricopeptide repeat protein [Gammaproteobacteria bacterium]